MPTLDAATLDDLCDALAEAKDKKPTQRLIAVINYLEGDDAAMAKVAERYGYTDPWLSWWVDRLADEPVEQVVYDDPRKGRPSDHLMTSTSSSWRYYTNHPKKPAMTRPRSLFR